MKENIRIEISEINQGEKQIITNRKYKFNFSIEKIIQRYIDARNIELQINIIEYESLHSHLKKEYETSKSIVKHKIKETLKIILFLWILDQRNIIKQNDNFMIFKNPNLIIFQSPFQAKLFTQYNEDIFADVISPINFHCDFEKGKSNIIRNSKNRLCSNDFKNNNNLYTYYRAISNFQFINTALIECYKNKEEKLI
ncbi:hypothetical protein U3516DRAFT_765649 [Neocallimastix sp. 'constans']